MPFFKNHMAHHRGHCLCPGFNKIAEAFKYLHFDDGIMNARCSFGWGSSNEGSKFWCEEDEVIHYYVGYCKSLDFVEERLKHIFENATLIRKKKF